jgi:multidrug efflux pump subunit AcrA (membrane-fusion protein)
MRPALKIILPFVVLALAAFGAYSLWKSRPQTVRQTPPEKSWVVESVRAKVVDIQPDLRLFGEVVAGRKVELRPLVPGQIVAVGDNFREGGVIAKGELLIAIDPFDYQSDVDARLAERAEARARQREIQAEHEGVKALLLHDKAQVAIRRRDVGRRQKLRGSGVSTVKTLDDARLALSENQQRLAERERAIEIWRSRLDQQKSAIARIEIALRRARRDLGRTRLVAPFDGFVLNVEAEIGKRLGVGDRVARLIDAARLEVRFHIGNTQFARLGGDFADRVARIYWDGATRPLEAVLKRAGSEIETASGGVNMYAVLRGVGAGTSLRPGAFVRVELPGPRYSGVVRLPESALHDGNTLYLIVDNRLVVRKTRLVTWIGSDILVQGGLKAGDEVLVTRIPEVGAGVLVSTP